MANAVFWICFALLVIALLVSSVFQSRQKKAAERENLKKAFESGYDACFDAKRFDQGCELFARMKELYPDDFVIDDITASDLMLKELYLRMNRSTTNAGEDWLYSRFRMMHRDQADADRTYNGILELSRDKAKAVELMYVLGRRKKMHDTDAYRLIRDLSGAECKSVLSDVFPLFVLILSVVACAYFPVAGLVAVIISICLCIGMYFSGKAAMDENLRGLALCLMYIRYGRELLSAGRDEFGRFTDLFGLSKAAFLISYKDGTTSNPLSILADYVRMITHVDLIAYKMKLKAVKEKIDSISDLYIETGRLDACLAVASFLNSRDHCGVTACDVNKVSAKDLYHPLIADPVRNDIDTTRGIILTGSNASGKSTFLKAVGVSALFAKSFGFAFASSFASGCTRLYTSMALSDDLLGGQSYYVVEAASIKRICDAAAGRDRTLCIIDEVLRGTNTIERIAASTVILRSLCNPNVICLAATHDLELPRLLEEKMDCCYFTEEIVGDSVEFPYLIQTGISDRTNAIRLLSVLDFDKKIVDDANNLADGFRKNGKWMKEE